MLSYSTTHEKYFCTLDSMTNLFAYFSSGIQWKTKLGFHLLDPILFHVPWIWHLELPSSGVWWEASNCTEWSECTDCFGVIQRIFLIHGMVTKLHWGCLRWWSVTFLLWWPQLLYEVTMVIVQGNVDTKLAAEGLNFAIDFKFNFSCLWKQIPMLVSR